jgi:hypothetical protein
VELADEAQRQRQLPQPADSVLQCDHVGPDLTEVFRTALHGRSRLSGQPLPERGAGALDPAGENGFAPDEGPDQQMRVGRATTFAAEASDGAVGVRQRADEPAGEPDSRR